MGKAVMLSDYLETFDEENEELSAFSDDADDFLSHSPEEVEDYYDLSASPLINVINFSEYMRKKGYLISSDAFGAIFSLMVSTGKRFDELEPAIRPMVVKDSAKIPEFILLFSQFIHNIPSQDEYEVRKLSKSAEKNKQRAAEIEEKLKNLEKKTKSKEKAIEKKEKEKENGYKTKKKALEREREKIKAQLPEIEDDVKSLSEEVGMDLSSPEEKKLSKAKRNEKLMKAAQMALSSKNAEKLLKYIKAWCIYFEKEDAASDASMEKALEADKQLLERYRKAKEKAEEEKERIEKALKNPCMKDIEKANSYKNREKFEKGKAQNAVRQMGRTDETVRQALQTDFEILTPSEKEALKDYIKDNARLFRTRLSGEGRTAERRKIDMSKTIKDACRSGGIPMKIHFKKPKKRKTNIVMVLDISGSCKEASYMMLYLMHCIQNVFPSGVRSYVFVDSLTDISSFFDSVSPDDAIDKVFANVKTKGVYSNYYMPLFQLSEEHLGEITKDSIVIFIGDARNNRNLSGEEFLKKVHDKTKKVFWLNTEEKSMWNSGDSIMGKYQPFVKETVETVNTDELIDALMQITEENR